MSIKRDPIEKGLVITVVHLYCTIVTIRMFSFIFLLSLDYGAVGVSLPQMEGFTLTKPVISHGRVRNIT